MPVISPAPSPNRFAILMSPAGRFLECLNCRSAIEFPHGALYETVAKEFESHSCTCPNPVKENDAPDARNRTSRRSDMIRPMDIEKLRALLDDIELVALNQKTSAESHGNAGNIHEAILAQGWASRLNHWARGLKEAIGTEN